MVAIDDVNELISLTTQTTVRAFGLKLLVVEKHARNELLFNVGKKARFFRRIPVKIFTKSIWELSRHKSGGGLISPVVNQIWFLVGLVWKF